MREISCSDCVVSVLIEITSKPTGEIVSSKEISRDQIGALSVLSEKGLIPPLRYAK